MAMQKFSMTEALEFGWDTMKDNIGFFIGLLVVAFLINIVPNVIAGFFKEEAPVLSLFVKVFAFVLQLLIGMGLIRISLSFCDNIKGELSDLFSCAPLLINYLVASIIYMLIIFGGIILLIVPGIIWAIKFQFFSYFIVDKGLGPIEALKKSAVITDGVKWDLFLFGLLLFGINILGALAFGIGLFATIPTTMLALAYVYRSLLGQIEVSPTGTGMIGGTI